MSSNSKQAQEEIISLKGGPAGGGYSTVEDFFKFSLAIRSHLLLSPESTVNLLEGKVARPDKLDITYAYGWQNVFIFEL